MTTAILLVLAGLVGLAIGGEWLVRGAVGIANRLGVSTLFTGLVIVGAATSMPELVTSVEAAIAGSPGIAWGNIVGSNIANTLLILGGAALVAPIVLTGTGKRDAVVGLAATVLVWFLTWYGVASPWLGVVLLFLIVLYVVWRYTHPRPPGEDDDHFAQIPLPKAILFFSLGVAVLVAGGQALVTGAIDLARLVGISETAIGLTVVAIGTSLPELAASIAAAWRGRPGIALGNVLGSNIYNLLLIGGVTMTIAPVPIPRELVDIEWPVVTASALLVLLLCAFAHRIGRPLGALLVVAFATNTVLLLA